MYFGLKVHTYNIYIYIYLPSKTFIKTLCIFVKIGETVIMIYMYVCIYTVYTVLYYMYCVLAYYSTRLLYMYVHAINAMYHEQIIKDTLKMADGNQHTIPWLLPH